MDSYFGSNLQYCKNRVVQRRCPSGYHEKVSCSKHVVMVFNFAKKGSITRLALKSEKWSLTKVFS